MNVFLVLASGPGQPEGDIADRLELSFDDAQETTPAETTPARRVLPDGREWFGELLRLEGDGTSWALRSTHDADEPLWVLTIGTIRPGEYATLRRPEGQELVFRVVAVEPTAPSA